MNSRCLVVWSWSGTQSPSVVAVCENAKAWREFKAETQKVQTALGFHPQDGALQFNAVNDLGERRYWTITGHEFVKASV